MTEIANPMLTERSLGPDGQSDESLNPRPGDEPETDHTTSLHTAAALQGQKEVCLGSDISMHDDCMLDGSSHEPDTVLSTTQTAQDSSNEPVAAETSTPQQQQPLAASVPSPTVTMQEADAGTPPPPNGLLNSPKTSEINNDKELSKTPKSSKSSKKISGDTSTSQSPSQSISKDQSQDIGSSNGVIDLHIDIRGKSNVYVDIVQLIEETYGKQNAASSSDSESGSDVKEGSQTTTAVEVPSPPQKPRRRRLDREDYDKNDPFIDDTEAAWEANAALSKDGFFVYSGPLIPKGKKIRIEKADGTPVRKTRTPRSSQPSTKPKARTASIGDASKRIKLENTSTEPKAKKADTAAKEGTSKKDHTTSSDSITAPEASETVDQPMSYLAALYDNSMYDDSMYEHEEDAIPDPDKDIDLDDGPHDNTDANQNIDNVESVTT